MNKTLRTILYVAGAVLVLYLLWYFSNIVIYILLSLVLALIGRPLFNLLEKVRYKRFYLPASLRAFITMIVLFSLVLFFFGLFIPLLVVKIHELSQIDPQSLISVFQKPLDSITRFINTFAIQSEKSFSAGDFIKRFVSKINLAQAAGVFTSIAGWLGNVSVAFFSIAFITFFFLRDDTLFAKAFLLVIPDKHVAAVENAMSVTRGLLSRYFIGMLAEMTAVIILSTIGLLLIGFSLRDSLLVGFLAGIFNIIPYLGPAMGALIGLFVGVVSFLGHPEEANLLLKSGLIIFVFWIVQIIDNMLVQPYVYSSSVHAHPLEIFIVFLMAGSIGGFAGMIMAIPIYTVIRVFAKEFLYKSKVVQTLTKDI